jgi:hypothetical protein
MSKIPGYGVMCRVSGGVTGTREAWLKSNDKRVEFATLAEAEAEAAHLRAQANGPHAKAFFHYWAERLPGELIEEPAPRLTAEPTYRGYRVRFLDDDGTERVVLPSKRYRNGNPTR